MRLPSDFLALLFVLDLLSNFQCVTLWTRPLIKNKKKKKKEQTEAMALAKKEKWAKKLLLK